MSSDAGSQSSRPHHHADTRPPALEAQAEITIEAAITGVLNEPRLADAVAAAVTHHALIHAVDMRLDPTSSHLGPRTLEMTVAAAELDIVGALRLLRDACDIYDERPLAHGPSREELIATIADPAGSAAALARRFWAPFLAREPDPALLARALRLSAPTRRLRNVAVPLAAKTLDELAARAATPGTGLEATVLHAWRATLAAHASDDDMLDVWRPGLTTDIPAAVGRFGRYVRLPIAAIDDMRTAAEIERWLESSDTLADLYPATGIDGTSPIASFASLRLPTPRRLRTDAVIDVRSVHAPIGGHVMECTIEHTSERPYVFLRCDDSLDDLAARALAADLLERLEPTDSGANPPRHVRGPTTTATVGLWTRLVRHAARKGQAPAIDDGERVIVYGELRAHVERTAGAMAACGVAQGDIVAIDLPRGLELIQTALAALTLGAPFLFLNRADPVARRRHVLADARPTLVVSEAQQDNAPYPVQHPEALDAGEPSRVEDLDLSDELAYVIYTSGSSGRPKGVEVTHGGLRNYLAWAAGRYAGAGGSLLHTDVAADLTLTSWMVPLWAGEVVRVVRSDEPEAFAGALMDADDLSFVKLTPSGLALLDAVLAPGCSLHGKVRHVVLGGEQLEGRHLTMLERFGLTSSPVTNEYGPTETVVGSAAYTFRVGSPQPSPVPIGTPIDNTSITVRDRQGRPCRTGIAGDLAIGGAGVARGYRRLAEETHRRFTISEDGAREFRTGDVCWIDEQGRLRYLSRADRQVKLHGFRVELDEVEHVLNTHEAVRRAAVTVGGRPACLQASIELEGGWSPASATPAIEHHAAAHLPSYALPDRLSYLDEIALTAAGKVDYRRLAATGSQAPAGVPTAHDGQDAAAVAVLAELWQQVLGVVPAQTDSFFGAGGDSISALRLVSSLRQAGWTIGMRDILARRTFASVAAGLQRQQVHRDPPESAGTIPLHPNQLALLAGRPDAVPRCWAIGCAVAVAGPLDIDRLHDALRRVTERHAALRTSVDPDARTARIHPADGLADPVVDIPDGTPTRAGIDLLRSSLDPATGVNCALGVRRDLSTTTVLVAVHHVVADLVSVRIVVDTLHDFYVEPQAAVCGDRYREIVEHAAATAPLPPFADLGASTQTRSVALRVTSGPITGLNASRRVADAVRDAAVEAIETDRLFGGVVVEGHGRSDESSGVVGWLTSYETVGDPHDARSAGQLLAVNFIGDHRTIATRWGPAEVDFPDPGADDLLLFAMHLTCWTTDQRVCLSWAFDPRTLERRAAERVADRFETCLLERVTAPQVTDTVLEQRDLSRILRDFS